MKATTWALSGALLGGFALVVGCTVNSTTNGGSACNTSSNVTCEGAATGYTCSGSSAPSDGDSTLDCSSGTPDNGNTDFCCISLNSSVTCGQDSTVQGCVAGSYGFSCTGSDTPDQDQAGLVCSTGTAGSNGDTLYCCSYTDDAGTDDGGTDSATDGSDTCMQDQTVTCTGSAQGWSCTGSDTPDQDQTGLVCSTGTAGNGDTQYCCIPFTSTTCMQDSTVQGCQAGSYGFSCTGTDTPSQNDSSLDCSTGTAGNNGETLYCCSD
jgi:hypothetical protein